MKIKLSELRRIIKSVINEEVQTLNEGETKVGAFLVDLEGGPAIHAKRVKETNMKTIWQNLNAWDLFASPGTKVTAYLNGTVTEIKDSGNSHPKVYGVAITVQGSDGHPDAYYSHLTNPQVKVGSKVTHGTYIGDIALWTAYPQWSHVHIAMSSGSLKDYINKKTTGAGGGQYRDIMY